MKPQVFIRTDGSTSIGLGHLVRCIALAHMIKDAFTIIFYCKDIPDSIGNEIETSGFGLIRIKDETDFFKTLEINLIVVLDGYHFDTEYQKQIKTKGSKLVCIDDLHDKEFVADLIINHAPGITPRDYKTQPYTQFALGVEYVLLRPRFLEQAKIPREIDKIKTAFICFGGSDFKNFTEKSLKIVQKIKKFTRIIVVTGAVYPFFDRIKKFAETDHRIEFFNSVNEDQMLQLLTQSDIAIVPSSGILFEALAAGCKVISGYYMDNQKLVFKKFLSNGYIESAGSFTSRELKLVISNVLIKKKITSRLIDGLSKKRLLNKFCELVLNVREFASQDCNLLFSWVNNLEVRKNAISHDPISFEDHLLWFNSKLTSSKTKIYILEMNGLPIGQVRYEENNDYWLIDYSIDVRFRGFGLGKTIIKNTIFLNNKQKLKAFVKHDNLSSNKIFLSLGFSIKSVTDFNGELFNEFELVLNKK